MKIKVLFEDLLKKLKKDELIMMVDRFHQFCEIYNYPIAVELRNYKKEEIINYLVDKQEVYIKFIVQSLDNKDFEVLKKMDRKRTIYNKNLNNYLTECHLIINSQMADDTYEYIKKILKLKSVRQLVKKNSNIYFLSSGVIVAYGVLSYDKFKDIIGSIDKLKLLMAYNHCSYKIEKDKVIAKDLKNKTKINKYLKNEKLKSFKNKEFKELGQKIYHHHFKTYQKLVNVLKKNYVFQKDDIAFLDNVIIMPYLYNNLKMEAKAQEILNKDIDRYFEFSNAKLKSKLVDNIIALKKEFPIWEYRGYSIMEESSK